jgi:hypothetical protein
MIMIRHARLLVLALLVLAVASGCGSGGPQIVPVEGTVTHNGEPVSDLRIYFAPTEGRPSWAVSDSSGHFVLDYDPEHKGAKVGTHKVWVVDQGAIVDPTAAMSGGGARAKRSPAIAQIVEKFGREKSTLEVEVKKADRNFQLKLD